MYTTLIQSIQKHRHFVLISHFRPDGDAIGSTLALGLTLKALGKKVEMWNQDPSPKRYSFLEGAADILPVPESLPEGVDCFMVDAHNRIRILMKPLDICKEEQYGKYISLIPLTTDVHGVTLEGFKYPLWDHRFHVQTCGSLGISNELVENVGKISFRQGILLMLECRD